MKDRETITRLLELRRLRENRAREAAARQRLVALRALDEVEKAKKATDLLSRQAAEEEKTTFGSLLDHPVSVGSLRRIQGRFEQTSEELARLRDAQAQAAAREGQCRQALVKARETHRSRRISVAKLERALEALASRSAPRRVAREELAVEEDSAPTAPTDKSS
jgi:DNA repair exonuclease SbcCD ATPase subunit